MRVFHFILDHRVGGPHAYVRVIAEVLRPGVTSQVVTTGHGAATDIALINLRHHWRWLYPLEVILNVFSLCFRFWRQPERQDMVFDVHGAANLAPILAARLMRIPVAWHFHETLPGYASLVSMGKAAITGTAHRHVVVAEKAARVFGIADACLIPGAVDTGFWQTAAGPAREEGDVLRLIAVGNLNPLKGFDILLQALQDLNQRWELVIVGAELDTYRHYAAHLRQVAGQLARPDCRVEFAGWQGPEAVRGLLARADVFVLSSRSEACPIALLEAMAMECPCVACDVGDVGKMLAGSECGMLVSVEAPEEMAAALRHMATMPLQARRAMGQRARERVIREYSQQRMAERHLEIYQELVREAWELN